MAKDTRLRMIEVTARLLQHRGYHGTSLSDILDHSGAPRGSLYFHFPGGKDQLVIEATRTAAEEATVALKEALGNAKNPAAGVRAYVELAAKIMGESDYTFGCPVAPVILDANADLKELADLCRRTFEDWIALLRKSFVDAGIPNRRARALALFVIAAIEGALLLARGYRDCTPIINVAAELEAVVGSALPRRRRAA
jgi:TetR/AcrR family transcriptional regulator, lmrAB and yxaGH operons repressor